MNYYSAIKRKIPLMHAIWVNLKNVEFILNVSIDAKF